MSSYNNQSFQRIHYLSFQRKVQDALQSVERALELERKPRLAEEVDHTYGAKYGLVDLTSNVAIIAFMNCFKQLGLDAEVLKSIDKTKPATLEFESSTSPKFLKEVTVDVPLDRTCEVNEITTEADPSQSKTKTKVMKLLKSSMKSMKAVNHIKEYHWEVDFTWSIYIYSGTSKEDKKIIKSRKCTTQIITQSKESLTPTTFSKGLSITWLLQQIDTDGLTSQFKVDVEADATKTPRRNDAVDNALRFNGQVSSWCTLIERQFTGQLNGVLQKHNPATPKPRVFTMKDIMNMKDEVDVFNPILPLMEEERLSTDGDEGADTGNKSILALQSANKDCCDKDDIKTLLSSNDMASLLNEHVRTLDVQINEINMSWPSGKNDILSSSEASLVFVLSHLRNLATQYDQSMSYIESMMEDQLVAAIGKRLESKDLDTFVKYHNARLLDPMPHPFSHAIRRPEHYPVGLLSIESQDGETECIHSHSREIKPSSNLKVPLSAATVLQLTGQQYLHGYMNHRFGTSHKSHQLVARARQFSAFILVIGTMTDGSTLDPKDAVIVQNKDELLIPLLLEELPTAKEFKDAIKSLSPEQQRFAKAYRKMQLSSSVFGICVIQIKPQLEALLGLPPDALDKEMEMTQSLMELFIEYQVPSDLLSYNGFSDSAATEDKISNVKGNVKSVMDVVTAEKEKQLKAEQAKTDMHFEQRLRDEEAKNEHFQSADAFESRLMRKTSSRRSAAPQRMMAMAMAAPPMAASRMASPQRAQMAMRAPPKAMMAASELRTTEMSLECDNQDTSQPSSANVIGMETNTEATKKVAPLVVSDQGMDFTLIPQILDTAIEKNGDGNAIRSTTIKTGDNWVRNRQENLLAAPKKQNLGNEEIKMEKNKAFDLLDALSRSGTLPIEYSELHVLVAVTHCFDKSVMSTVVQDNVNPIEKLERSTLLLASAMHGVPARELIKGSNELQRLEGAMPLLMGVPENSNEDQHET